MEEALVGVDGATKGLVGDPLSGGAWNRWSDEAFLGKYFGEPAIGLLRFDTSASAITVFISTRGASATFHTGPVDLEGVLGFVAEGCCLCGKEGLLSGTPSIEKRSSPEARSCSGGDVGRADKGNGFLALLALLFSALIDSNVRTIGAGISSEESQSQCFANTLST